VNEVLLTDERLKQPHRGLFLGRGERSRLIRLKQILVRSRPKAVVPMAIVKKANQETG